ncbi:hypothetical protein ACTFIT_003881 [Dictyostelium discoideum]
MRNGYWIGNCHSFISFGSRRTTLKITNSANRIKRTGVLSTNQIFSNIPNSQTFVKNVYPLATLFYGAVPPPQLLPNIQIVKNLPTDFFEVKSLLETIPMIYHLPNSLV